MECSTMIGQGVGNAAGLALAATAVVMLLGAAPDQAGVQDFEEITVQRINIVEPDGSLNMVISSSARMHPGRIGGADLPARERPPGILFFDSAGDEAGGLGIFGADGNRYGGIVVDQVGNDESVRLFSQQVATDRGFVHQAGLSITDWNPDQTLPELMALMEEVRAIEDPAEQQARIQELEAQNLGSKDRLFVGRHANGAVLVNLADATGTPRLRMVVSDEGDARIEFLDADGAVIKALTPDS